METQTETKPRTRGRKERTTGQEAVIEASIVTDRLEELVQLHTAQQDATAAYSDAVKAVAEKSGLLANVVQKYVKARASDKSVEKKREAAQLVLLFEECGE